MFFFFQCSSTCAGGFQRRVVVCQDADGRSNSYCDERVKPAESKSCDSGPCPLWNYGVWGEVRLYSGLGEPVLCYVHALHTSFLIHYLFEIIYVFICVERPTKAPELNVVCIHNIHTLAFLKCHVKYSFRIQI